MIELWMDSSIEVSRKTEATAAAAEAVARGAIDLQSPCGQGTWQQIISLSPLLLLLLLLLAQRTMMSEKQA